MTRLERDMVTGLVLLSGPGRDGSKVVGRQLGPVQPYWDAGTPVANKMRQSSVDLDAAARVRVGDRLEVSFDGDHWRVSIDLNQVGVLNLSASSFEPRPWRDVNPAAPGDCVLEVTRLYLSPSGVVINFGGILHPKVQSSSSQ